MKFFSFTLFLLSSFSLLGAEAVSEVPAIPEPQAGFDPLHIAAWKGDVRSIDLLVRGMGASVNATDSHGITALHLASIAGKAEAAQVLLGLRANIDALAGENRGVHSFEIEDQQVSMQGGKSSLYYAVQNKDVQLVGMLVANGAKYKKSEDLLGLTFPWKKDPVKDAIRRHLMEASKHNLQRREGLRRSGNWIKGAEARAVPAPPPGSVERAPSPFVRVLRADATVLSDSAAADSEVLPARVVRVVPPSHYGTPSAPIYYPSNSRSAAADEFGSSAPVYKATVVVNVDDQMSP